MQAVRPGRCAVSDHSPRTQSHPFEMWLATARRPTNARWPPISTEGGRDVTCVVARCAPPPAIRRNKRSAVARKGQLFYAADDVLATHTERDTPTVYAPISMRPGPGIRVTCRRNTTVRCLQRAR